MLSLKIKYCTKTNKIIETIQSEKIITTESNIIKLEDKKKIYKKNYKRNPKKKFFKKYKKKSK